MSVLLALLLALPASASSVDSVRADAHALSGRMQGEEAIAALAAELTAKQMPFPELFRRVCAEATGRPDAARLIFGGLYRWQSRGGFSELRGRSDAVQHFVLAGWAALAAGVMASETAAYQKEVRDAFVPDNAFDLDDLALSCLGARLASRFAKDPRRLEEWASGKSSLTNLPVELGKLSPRSVAGPLDWMRVDRWLAAALR